MTKLIADEFTDEARRLLEEGSWRTGDDRTNSVTGCAFVHGLDPLKTQIKEAAAALRAKARLARERPDLPPMPLNYWEREANKYGVNHPELPHAMALFARSLESNDYDLDKHPSFDDYMRGLFCYEHMKKVFPALWDRFPPKPLTGLRPGYSYWKS